MIPVVRSAMAGANLNLRRAMTPTSNRQTRMIVILILFLGFVGGYVYYSNFVTSGSAEIAPLPDNSRDTLSQFKDIQFNFQIFSSAALKQLRLFGEVPVIPETTGRINPFASF